jgi:hypothetical protein
MTQTFDEFVLGDVLLTPFVLYAAAALLILLVCRLVVMIGGINRRVSIPPIGLLCLYVVLLAILTTAI